MPNKYFDLCEDLYVPGRWELDELYNEGGVKLDGYDFRRGAEIDFDGSIRISIYRPGTPLDFCHPVSALVPVVSRRVAELLTNLAANDIQLLPARIESQADEHYIVNARRTVKCIDDTASKEVRYWHPEDGQPDKLGGYRAVHGLRVNPSRIPSDIRIFRPQGWTVVLLISEEIRDALKEIGATGTKFIPV